MTLMPLALTCQPMACMVWDESEDLLEPNCKKYLKFKEDACEEVRSNRSKPKGHKAKQAEQTMPEFAGNASALSTFDPTTLQSNTDFHWLTDTGTTSHMMPHRAWMCNYTSVVPAVGLSRGSST
jgi:hypothetical protein